MKARTLKIGEEVCIALDGTYYIGMGNIVAIDGKRKDFHLSGDEHNVDVEITLTKIEEYHVDDRVGDNVHVDNDSVFQIVEGKTYHGHVVCYEHDDGIPREYYSPEYNASIDEDGLDDAEWYCGGYDFVQKQIASGRWDLDSDTFDIKEALADAWNAGLEQGRKS